jgi:serpin B
LALELQSRSEAKGITPDKAFHLSVANSLWGQSGSPFEPDFLYLLARNYGAGMRSADFAADSEAARQAINDWVSQSTEDRIKDIIPPGALDAFTRMVLANAVYFKAAWEHPFAQQFTSAQPFQLLDGSSISVPTMVEAEDMGYLQGDGYRAVDLPYAGGQLSMLILLPDEGRFGDMEGKLNPALINDTVSKLTTGEVILSMPKFKFEWSTGLSDGLAALGMVDAFDPRRADFSGIDGKHDLSISAALHKAFIAVDESGTEAAAATVILAVGSDMTNVPKVQLDRPFFFLIRDNPTGTILFVGRVVNPSVS